MGFLTAIAISLCTWIAGIGLAGGGASWLPAQVPAWSARSALGPILLAQPVEVTPRPAALADPWFGAVARPRVGAAGVPAAQRALPRVAGRRPLTIRTAATAPPPPPTGTPRRPRLGAVRPTSAGEAARPQPAMPSPPPGSFMTQADYERVIAARLARRHPQFAPAVRREIAAAIAERALAWGLDPWLVYADIRVESGFRPRTVGAAGEIGLMQVLPTTARMVARDIFGLTDFRAHRLYDPAWNVRIGTAYLGLMMERHRGDVAVALAAYNAGLGVVGPTGYTYRVLAAFRRVSAGAAGDA